MMHGQKNIKLTYIGLLLRVTLCARTLRPALLSNRCTCNILWRRQYYKCKSTLQGSCNINKIRPWFRYTELYNQINQAGN